MDNTDYSLDVYQGNQPISIRNVNCDFFDQILAQEDIFGRILERAMDVKCVVKILKHINQLERAPTPNGKNFVTSIRKHRNMLHVKPSKDVTMTFFENQCSDRVLFRRDLFEELEGEIKALFCGATQRKRDTSPGQELVAVSLKKMLQFASKNTLRLAPPIVNTMNSTVAISVLLAFYLSVSNLEKGSFKSSYDLSISLISTLTSAESVKEWQMSTRNAIVRTPKKGAWRRPTKIARRLTPVAHLPNICSAEIHGKQQNAYHICCLVEEAGCLGYHHTIVYFDLEDKPHKYTHDALRIPIPGAALPLDAKQVTRIFAVVDRLNNNSDNEHNSNNSDSDSDNNDNDSDNDSDINDGDNDSDINDGGNDNNNDINNNNSNNNNDINNNNSNNSNNNNNNINNIDDNEPEELEKNDGKRSISEVNQGHIREAGTSKRRRTPNNNNNNNSSSAKSTVGVGRIRNNPTPMSPMLTRLEVRRISGQ